VRIDCPISSIEYYNSDTRRVILTLPAGPRTGFKAGQYLEMILPQDPPKKCPFSIANAPDISDIIELHIRPTPGSDDSVAIEALLDSTDHIEIEMPRGDCFLENAPDKPLILMAASTGITQMKSIFEHLIHLGHNKPVSLYWGVVADKDLYLDELCKGWVNEYSHFDYTPVVSEPDSSPQWQGRTGLVGDVVLEDFKDLSDVLVYVSGGPGMVYATLDAFMERGMPESNMFSDVFSYAPR
jgi:CDP-4-dehydro-6-deoxyglucose reductase, E3